MSLKVSAINTFHIKSCAGTTLNYADIDERGIHYDRHWMLVDKDGRFMTQREHPRMALIRTTLEGDWLQVRIPDKLGFSVPKREKAIWDPSKSDRELVRVWKDEVSAVAVQTSSQLSEFLQTECHLVRMSDAHLRRSRGTESSGTSPIAFPDGYPFLIISQASLDDLNGRMKEPLPMDRFRPTLVVTGCEPYEEDLWDEIVIGGITFRGGARCVRCAVTTVNQETGVRGKEPLATLASYRRTPEGVVFGRYFVHHVTGTIFRTDPVQVIRRSEI